MLVATVVSPQLTLDNADIGNAVNSRVVTLTQQNIPQLHISEPLMSAPKSPLPKQKIPTPELPPIFHRIAFCESSDRQFDENGEVVRGAVNSDDVGRYQINAKQWSDEAQKLGYDLLTEDGNEAMALYLYKKYGTKPWKSSQKCWEKADQAYASRSK